MNMVRYCLNDRTVYEVMPTAFSVGDLGIFTYLDTMGVPWQSLEISQILNRHYYGYHSGDKIIAPLVEKFLGSNTTLTTEDVSQLAQIAHTIYNKRWLRMWEVYNFEYNPGNNYDMIENYEENGNNSGTRNNEHTNDLTHSKTGEDTVTYNTNEAETLDTQTSEDGETSETQTPNLTKETDRGVYAFNETDNSVPSEIVTENTTGSSNNAGTSKKTTKNTGTDTVAKTGTDQTSYNTTDKDTGTHTDEETTSNEHSVNHTLTRKGNIGVTTTQQMLQSDIELWVWNFFTNVVYPDIDRVLTISVY